MCSHLVLLFWRKWCFVVSKIIQNCDELVTYWRFYAQSHTIFVGHIYITLLSLSVWRCICIACLTGFNSLYKGCVHWAWTGNRQCIRSTKVVYVVHLSALYAFISTDFPFLFWNQSDKEFTEFVWDALSRSVWGLYSVHPFYRLTSIFN